MTGNEAEDVARRREQAFADAAQTGRIISQFEDALERLKGMFGRAVPDFGPMTSLAQYGFNMGEKEDTENMEKYYSQLTDYVRQIKDELIQGIRTQAIYQ